MIKYSVLVFVLILNSCFEADTCYHKYNYIQQRPNEQHYYAILVNAKNIREQYLVKTDHNFQAKSDRNPIVYDLQKDSLSYQKWIFPRKETCIEHTLYTVPAIKADLCKKAQLEIDTISLWKGRTISVELYVLKPDPTVVDLADLQQEIYFIPSLGIIWKQLYENPLWGNYLVSMEECNE